MNPLNPDQQMKLAVLVICFSMAYFFCVTFIPIPATGEDNAKYIIGFLVGTGLTTIIAYYFRKGSVPEPGDKPEKEKES
jgi:hypothetical protein